MKKITLTACCTILVAMILGSSAAIAKKPTSYPLMCRGGGTMKTTILDDAVAIEFVGGRQGAGVRPPAPGQCTWLDRGFRPGEPLKVVWRPKSASYGALHAVQFDAQGRITWLSIQNRDRDSFFYLYNKIRRGEIFQLHAYLDTCRGGKKCTYLTSKRAGP